MQTPERSTMQTTTPRPWDAADDALDATRARANGALKASLWGALLVLPYLLGGAAVALVAVLLVAPAPWELGRFGLLGAGAALVLWLLRMPRLSLVLVLPALALELVKLLNW